MGGDDVAHSLAERVKELTCLHETAALLLQATELGAAQLTAVATLLTAAMQYPEIATACIRLRGTEYVTPGHAPTPWILRAVFTTRGGTAGELEVAYREERPAAVKGPFLAEESSLLESVAGMLRVALEREEAVNELRTSDERFKLALDAAGMAVWELDCITNATRWSAQLARMVGIEPTSGEYKRYRDLVHPDDQQHLYARIAAARAGLDTLSSVEVRFARPEGGWRPMVGMGRLVRGDDGAVVRIVIAVIDVTERRQLEDGLRHSQKLEALGHVASGVAHDFNNLLMVLFAGTDTLRRRLSDDSTLSATIHEMQVATETATALTRQLLTFSRKATFQPTQVDVGVLVRRLEPILRRIAGSHVRIDVALGAAPAVWADPAQIEQVVMNLVVNARDAMPEGGVITVTVRETPDRALSLEVADNGAGIAPDVLQHIFEPFFTTKEEGKGTGLGLAVVQSVAKQWRGTVGVESEVGRGTRFRVTLPAALPA